MLGNIIIEASQRYYAIENGLIIYETNTTSRNFQSNTIKTLVFKNFGAVELIEEIGYVQSGKNSFAIHTMSKRENEIFYTVNFEQKRIDSFPLAKFTPLTNVQTDKYENILAYTCKVIELPTSKLWVHKGIILKQTTRTNEIQTRSRAVKIVFNASLKPELLKLPDFKNENNISDTKVYNKKEHLINGVDISDIIEGAQLIESILN